MSYGNEHILANRRQFLDAYERARRQFSKLPGVVGVGMGHKQTGGRYAGDLAITVYVEQKKAESALPADHVIPREFEGYRTDVLVVPYRVPGAGTCNDDTRYSTIKGGIMIQAASSEFRSQLRDGQIVQGGTIACIVRKRGDSSRTNVHLLTNRHVLLSNGARDGDYVFHPKLGECCLGPVDSLGFNGDVRYTPAGGTEDDYYIDCGTLRLHIDSECCWSVCTRDSVKYSTTINGLALNGSDALSDVRSVINDMGMVGMKVFKVGRRTRRTVGFVRDIRAPVQLPGLNPGDPVRHVHNAIRIEFDPASTSDGLNCNNRAAFGEVGDSGAAVVDEQSRIIGICFGFPEDTDGPDLFSLSVTACHILPVLDRLSICVPTTTGSSHGSCGATDGSGIAAPPGGSGGSGGSGGGKVRSILLDPPAAIEGGALEPALDPEAERERLERIRVAFCETQKGREMHDSVDFLKREVGWLVNHRRPVTAAWHRNKGPAFLARFIRHLREGKERVPQLVDGVTLEALLAGMRDVLRKHGSNPLREAIEKFEHDVFALARAGDTVEAFTAYLRAEESGQGGE